MKEIIEVNQCYDSSSIYTTEGLEHVRLRPTAYISDKGISGQLHIIKEVVDNAIDEAVILKEKGSILVVFFRDIVNSTYQVLIVDNGRGIPVDKLLSATTVLNTSGKFNTESYAISVGTYGLGLKAAAGLSRRLRVISVRPRRLGGLLVKQGKAPDCIDIIHKKNAVTGTYVLMEPDQEIFENIPEFLDTGYEKLLDLFKLFNLFSNYHIELRVYPSGIPDELWEKDIDTTLDAIESYVANSVVTFNNHENQSDQEAYVRDYFNITRPFSWSHKVVYEYNKENKLSYTLMLYATKYDSIGGVVSLINNNPIFDVNSSHIAQSHQVLRKVLSDYVSDTGKKAFVKEQYKVPVYMLLDVKYSGAEFIGAHKTSFKDSAFSRIFGKLLTDQLSTNGNKQRYKDLYELLVSDIDHKYSLFTTGSTLAKNDNRLVLELNYPDKFSNCMVTGPEAELFLSEGASAGSNEGRDSRIQATYQLRGKPLNPITTEEAISESSIKAQKFDIFQDILKIIGLTPTMTDFSQLKYGKVFIMVDADTHGKHITNLILGSLYVVNPAFIESGIVRVVTPPLFLMKLKNLKTKAKTLFIRSTDEFVEVLAKHVYYNMLEIGILSPGVFDQPRILNSDEFVEFCKIVAYVGDTLTRLSNEHIIDPIILEQLTHVSYYLTPATMNIEVLKSVLGYEDISYDSYNNILTISIGRQDVIVSLYAINTSLYREILPFLNRICWKQLGIVITSKLSDLYKNTAVSFVQLYQIFKSLEDLFEIKRLKGLGSMLPADRARTCMDVRYRTAVQIMSIGDIPTVFNMLGSNADHRKELLRYR